MKKPTVQSLEDRPFAALELACLNFIELELAKALPERDYHLVCVLKDAIATCHSLQAEKERLEEKIMEQRQEIISLTGRAPREAKKAPFPRESAW